MSSFFKKYNILFMGTSDFAVPILGFLHKQGVPISVAITQPDKKVGRKQTLSAPAVKIFAQENKIPLKQYKKIDKEALSEIKSFAPDLIIVAAYGLILPKELLDMPTFGCINVHGSLLPKYRGASPIQEALKNSDEKTGITLMKMDEGVDTGDLLAKKETLIDPNETFSELEKKLALTANEIILDTLEKYFKKELTPTAQDDSLATKTKLIKKQDGEIDWNLSAKEIYGRYRAFKKWPGIFTFFNDNNKRKKLSLQEIAIGKAVEKIAPGQVCKKDAILMIGTQTDPIIIKKLTPEGSKQMNALDFINGKPDFVNSTLK